MYTFTKYKGFDPGASNGNPIGGGIDYVFILFLEPFVRSKY
jgi:hypothetical protein